MRHPLSTIRIAANALTQWVTRTQPGCTTVRVLIGRVDAAAAEFMNWFPSWRSLWRKGAGGAGGQSELERLQNGPGGAVLRNRQQGRIAGGGRHRQLGHQWLSDRPERSTPGAHHVIVAQRDSAVLAGLHVGDI